MRRGEKALPVYKASGLGSARTMPFKRATVDSIPHHECENAWCGTHDPEGTAPFELLHRTSGGDEKWRYSIAVRYHFCSYGCLSRWAIVEELRS